MLSTEPDLPCPSEISSKLKSISTDERERVSDNSQQYQHQLDDDDDVDLFKSDYNPLPNFSIRDYVFGTRDKDIKTHWPFSSKNLQLCLKHGVKDVLPPFQTLESVRNTSIGNCVAEDARSNSVVKLSRLSDDPSLKNISRKLVALDIENIKSSSSGEDKEDPSNTASLSRSYGNSVPLIKDSCLEPEAQNLPGSSVEIPESVIPSSSKVEINTQNPVKKCKLIVKLSNIAEPKSNEESSFNTFVVSETMASKVCPVCKTFTSSSNTTLNAHIDQCLSGESKVKWTTDSKVIKHRIKPRKTRLMVDIYATALSSTLEDLDRRNGTNWASNLGFPAQDLNVYTEEKDNTHSSVNREDKNDEGAVYYDSNGTKLRILSKFSDLQSDSNAKDDSGHRKLVKRDKGSKLLSSKKNKNLVQTHKILSYPHVQRSSYPGVDHCPEVTNGQERKYPSEDDEDLAQSLKDCDQLKSNGFGMVKQWVGSKRTGLKKKRNLEHEAQQQEIIIKDLRVESNVPSKGDNFIKRTNDSSSPMVSDDNPPLTTENHKSKEDLSLNPRDECMEQPFLRKIAGVSLLESRDSHGKKNHQIHSKYYVKQSKEDGPSVHKRHTDPPSDTEDDPDYRHNKKMRSISPTINADSSLISPRMSRHHILSSGGKKAGSVKKTSLAHAPLSGGRKLSSLRKNLLSVRHTSVSESKKNSGRKQLDFKKPRLHYTSGSDEEADQSASHRQDNMVKTLGKNAAQMGKASSKPFIDEARVLKTRKRRVGFLNSGKEGDKALKCSDASPEFGTCRFEKNIVTSVGDNVPAGTSIVPDNAKEVEIQNEFLSEPIPKISGEEAPIALVEPLNSGFPALSGSDVELVSQHYIKAYEGQEMFSSEKVGKDLVSSHTHVVGEIDVTEGQGNYFIDVDPIPIPGPPGSFLPSPGRMASEELQGNSSLTTSRVHSSEDEHEVMDMDSSDSPISATSFVSNPVASVSDSVPFMNLTMQSHGAHYESHRGISEYRLDPAIDSSIPFNQTAAADGKPKLDESRNNFVFPETSARRFKNSQPCCCSRKEGVSQSGSLNYPQSQLLRPQNMTSLPPEMDGDRDNNTYSFNLRSPTVPEKEPTQQAEKVVANAQRGYADVLVPRSSEAKFPTYGDLESPSPSTSNPVLRLMGKNLMVVNKEENLSPQTRPTQSSMVNDHSGILPSGNIQVERWSFDPRTLSGGPPIFDNTQSHMPVQHLDFTSSGGSRVGTNFRGQELSPHHPSRVVLSSKSFGVGGGLISSTECCDYEGGYINFTPVPQLRAADYYSGGKHKEVIVIHDDAPESRSRAVVYESKPVLNPLYSFQTRCYPIYTGTEMTQNANTTQVPMNGNSVNWNRTTGGPNVGHPNSLSASSSPSTGQQLRSSVYFSPGFSLPANFT